MAINIPDREQGQPKQFRRPPPGMSQKPRQKGPYASQPPKKKRRRMTPAEEQAAMEAGQGRLNGSGYYGRAGGGAGKGGATSNSGFAAKGPYDSKPLPTSGRGNSSGFNNNARSAALARRLNK